MDFPVVGVGASAGGLEAFTQLLQNLSPESGMAFVLVQHLDPLHDSALGAILGRSSRLPVSQVKHLQRVEPNQVYIIPPDTALTIGKGRLLLRRRARGRDPHRPIDVFFDSLARERGNRAIGVVLSGTGSDGTLGLEAIKAEGGITFAQDDSAKYDAMPRSAEAAGCVDLVLEPAAIAAELMRMAKHPVIGGDGSVSGLQAEVDRAQAVSHAQDATALPSGGRKRGRVAPQRDAIDEAGAPGQDVAGAPEEAGYRKILSLLRGHSGVDFSLYKSPTIRRRIARRLVLTKHDTPADYAAFLQGNASELEALYSDVLISVTSFFRNPEVFELLQRDVIPALLRQGDDPVRVWVLGCSTGQEAYSIAMSFVEASDQVSSRRKLQVFATDLNESLLDKARQGLYARSLAEDVSPTRLRRFFVEEEGGYRVAKSLRQMVVFARQNVIADPPFSRLDLVSCRNLLIYLEPVLQQKAIPTFHYALKPGGFLLLGASESVSGFSHLFEPLDRKHKVYRRKPGLTDPNALSKTPSAAAPDRAPQRARSARIPIAASPLSDGNAPREADRLIAQQFGPPSVLIDDAFHVLQFRGPTGAYLEPPSGKASFDVLKMARDGLMLPLRAALTQARKEGKAVRRENVRIQASGSTRAITLQVLPLRNLREPCYLVLFLEAQPPRAAAPAIPPAVRLGAKAERARILELEGEVVEIREYMQSMQEQSESAQEELQASSEEVQSANEELQSVNEELETSKEELESANEELTTVNEEMAHRNAELSRLNADLVNLQSSVRMAVLWVGRDLRLRSFSPQAEKQFDLQSNHLGQPLAHLRHRLSAVDAEGALGEALDLEKLAATALQDVREHELELRSEEGRSYSLRVRPYVTLEGRIDGVVLVFVDVDEARRLESLIRESRDLADGAFAAVRHPTLVLDRNLTIELANPAYYRLFRTTPRRTEGRPLVEVNDGSWNRPELLDLLQFSGQRAAELRLQADVAGLGRRTLLLAARRITDLGEGRGRSMLVIEDVTERDAADALRAQQAAIMSSCNDAIFASNLRGEVTSWNEAAERLFGYPAAAMLGQPAAMLLANGDAGEDAKLTERVRHGERLQHYETRGRRRDGSTFEISMTVSAVTDSEGRMMGTAKIVRDHTERSRLQREMKENSDALADLHRRKDEFLAMLSHELRSPLAAISNAAHLLGRVPLDDRVQLEAGAIIERQSGQLTRLVDDLLDVSRITTGRIDLARERIDLCVVVQRAVETVSVMMDQRRHVLTLNCNPESVFVLADPARLEQVFVNLLTNAAKYSDAGGSVVVSVARGEREVSVSVADTGEGIAPDMLPRMFDLFAQADRTLHRASGGLGLGLSLVQRLVQLHGGRVEASSRLGEGSEFIVWLPIEPDQRATKYDAIPVEASAGPLRVLVVEDLADVARSLKLLLQSYGHVVHTVDDGAAARDAALEFGPDVVLLDIGLPGMSGYDVARQLRAEGSLSGLVLIALTGYGAREDQDRSREAGIDHHLVKPVDLDVLKRILGAIRSVPQS